MPVEQVDARAVLDKATHPGLKDPRVAQGLAEYVAAASADSAYRGSIVSEVEVEGRELGLAIESLLDMPDYSINDATIAAIHTKHGFPLTTPGSHHALRGRRLWDLGSDLALHDPFFIPRVINQGNYGFDIALTDPEGYIAELNEVNRKMGPDHDLPRRFLGMLTPQRP